MNIGADTTIRAGISDGERLKITEYNTKAILRILDLHDIKASFFVEVSIAEKLQNLLKAISAQGHEIAFYNKDSSLYEMEKVKNFIQDFLEKQIRGIRQKEQHFSLEELKSVGF